MAVAFKTALGTGQATTSGTTIVITTTAAIAIGDLVVVRWASDNLNATTPTATCADGGNTYSVLRQAAVNATAAAGVAGGMLATKATVARGSGSTITVTLSGAVAHKCAMAESFTGAESTTRVAAVGATGTATAASAGATAAGLVAGDLVLGHLANETRGTITGDTDTTNGAWSTQVTHRSSTSGSDVTNVSVAGQYKIVTATGAQTYNVTAVAAEWLCQCVVLQASPEPSITQAAYQFFDDAGTESGAAALGALNTAISPLLVGADGFGALRIRLQATTAVAVPASDWQLQWEKNASGSWTNASTGGTTVVGYDNPNLTGTGATTNRLGAGTGSFVAGEVCEDGVANAVGWTASNYTELLFSLTLKAVNLAGGDVLRFRVLRNGVTTTMTYSVTPTINIKGPIQVVGSSGGTSTATGALTVRGLPLPIPETGLNAWWDAADTATITHTGGAVSQWRDKGPGGNHANKRYGNNPITGTRTINGLNAIDFGDGDDMGAGPYQVQYFYTFVVVLKVDSFGAYNSLMSNSSSNPSWFIHMEGASGRWAMYAGPPERITSTTLADTQPHVFIGTIDFSGYGSQIWVDGVPVAPGTQQAGGWNGGEVFMVPGGTDALIGEMISYGQALTVPERQQVEEYLREKWFHTPAEDERVQESGWGRTTEAGEPRLQEGEMPVPVTGLAGWWDMADEGVIDYGAGDYVAQWKDKSGGDYHATQTTYPQFQLRRVAGAINGKPGLLCDNAAMPTTRRSDTKPVTVVFAARTPASPGGTMIGGESGALSIDINAGNWRALKQDVALVGQFSGAPADTAVVGTFTYDATNEWVWYMGGVQKATGTAAVTFDPGKTYGFGSHSKGGSNPLNFNGHIGEVFVYDRVLTTVERQQVEAYLTTKWLTAPPIDLSGGAVGISTAGGSLTVGQTIALVGAAGGSSTAGATVLRKAIPMVATAGGLSTATATTTAVARSLAGSTGGLSTTTAAAIVNRGLTSTSTGTSTATGAIGKPIPMVGTADATSTAVGDLDVVKAGVGLEGPATGVSVTAGTMSVALSLTGTSVASSATATAPLVVARALVATSPGTSTATAALARAVPVAGSAAGLSATTGALLVSKTFVASASGTSSATGSLVVARALTAPAAAGSSTATATMAAARPLTAATAGGSTATGALIASRPLAASAVGASTATGDLIVARALVASSDGASSASANMFASAAGGMSALVVGSSTATGSLRVSRALAGSSGGGSTAGGTTLSRTILLITSFTGGSTLTAGTIVVARPLSGSSGGSSTATGSFNRAVSLAGTSGGISTATGSLGRGVPLTGGPVAGSSTTTGAVRVARSLVGSSSGLSTATGATRVALTLAGTAGGISTADALELSLVAGLFGSAAGFSTADGVLTVLFIVPTYGLWNGEVFNAMQYGDKQVVDWMLTPP